MLSQTRHNRLMRELWSTKPWGRNRCPGAPHKVSPTDHARRLSQWLTRTDQKYPTTEHEDHWGAAITWISLAAGLLEVKIDLTINNRASYMCSQAWPYEDAQNSTASRVHTELTRLLYAYCAVESITRAMSPSYGDDGNLKSAAKPILKRFTGALPNHSLCTVDHIYDHCKNDKFLSRDRKLERSFKIIDGKIVLPLQAGVQLRHLLAHGIFRLPSPNS